MSADATVSTRVADKYRIDHRMTFRAAAALRLSSSSGSNSVALERAKYFVNNIFLLNDWILYYL